MLNNIEGAIFDLDGTLVDSMWVWEQIDIDYLKKHGHDMPKNLKDEICHLGFQNVAVYFKERFKIADSVENIMKTWHNMAYYHYKNNVKLKPGAKEFLENLKKSNIKIALATSNSLPLLEVCLESNGIYHLFDSIITTNEVERGKDFPDVYLLAADKIGVKPEHCIVFEDILPAVRGASKAGMKVIAVRDDASLYQKEDLESLAYKYIYSYEDLAV